MFSMWWTLFLPRPFVVFTNWLWVGGNDFLERFILGITYRVRGWEHVPEGSCIIAAKHQSEWETLKLQYLFGDPSVVLKQELVQLPIIGYYAKRMEMIPVDRAGKGKSLNVMLKTAQSVMRQGRKIVIFPQGTRIAVGDKKPYKVGVAALAAQLNLPVIPMALNSGVFCPVGKAPKRSGVITVEFLPALTASPKDTRSFMRELEQKLETKSNELAAEAMTQDAKS